MNQASLFRQLFGHLSPATQSAYEKDLKAYVAFLFPRTPDEDLHLSNLEGHLEALLSKTQVEGNKIIEDYAQSLVDRSCSSATVARRVAMLKTAVREAYRLGRTKWLPSVRIPKPRSEDQMRAAAQRNRMEPEPEEFTKLTSELRNEARYSLRAVRDLAIIRLMGVLGLRLSEVIRLRVRDLVGLTGQEAKVTIISKGRSAPELRPLPPRLVEDLQAWLNVRKYQSPDSPLFVAVSRGGNPGTKHLTQGGLRDITYRLGKNHLPTRRRNLNPHSLRHFTGTQVASAIEEMRIPRTDGRRYLGHKKDETFERYVKTAERTHRKLAERLDQLTSSRADE